MDVEAYISSGILELYIAGALTEEENSEVYLNAKEYPRIMEELVAIEAAILNLSQASSPKLTRRKGFDDLRVRIGQRKDTTVVRLPRKKTNWGAYTGWAAAILLSVGLYWFYNETNRLGTQVDMVRKEKEVLEQQIFDAKNSLSNTNKLLETIRDKEIQVVSLGGQQVAPNSFARVYWNRNKKQVLVDARGLPDPPPGMVYQVWSLKLSPLTPSSIGLLENFNSDDNKIFALLNPNESEAFGITLEPAGGSETPTMEQLYTLGKVTAS